MIYIRAQAYIYHEAESLVLSLIHLIKNYASKFIVQGNWRNKRDWIERNSSNWLLRNIELTRATQLPNWKLNRLSKDFSYQQYKNRLLLLTEDRKISILFADTITVSTLSDIVGTEVVEEVPTHLIYLTGIWHWWFSRKYLHLFLVLYSYLLVVK